MSNKFLSQASQHIDDAIIELKKYIEFFNDKDVKDNIINLYDIKDFIDYLDKGIKIKKQVLDFNNLMED